MNWRINTTKTCIRRSTGCVRALYKRISDQLEILFNRYEEIRFTVPHHIYQRRLLQYAVDTAHTIRGLKLLEDEAFTHFDEQQYYSLILFYAPLWGQFYEQLHAYKQASHCYRQALEASEKVRQRMSS